MNRAKLSLVPLLVVLVSVIPDSRANNNALYQCGVRNRAGSPLISDGQPATMGDWPWHAAVFVGGVHICAATLFDQRHVLTAAHCVSRRYQNEALRPDELTIHLGKHDLVETSTVQVMNVSEVNVFPKYGPNSPRIDIALLVLSSDVVFSDYVIPICLDRKEELSIARLVGQQGWIAGWGVTKNGSTFDRLLSVQLLVASSEKCAMQHPWYVAQLLSDGMFCANGQNGTSFRASDNGGGLFVNEGHRWVLKGVKVLSQVDIFAKSILFTNVHHYLGWIRRLTSATDISNVPNLQANDLYQCGVRKRLGIQLIHHGWVAELGQWPWHAGLHHYTKSGSAREYKCGATLLDQRHVLTSAHCVSRNNGVAMDAKRIAVHLGQYDLRDMSGVLIVNVSEVHVHPEFSTNRNDIAILILDWEVAYTDYVLPICLDEETTEEDISKYVGQRGFVVGWGKTEHGNVPRLLRAAQMPIVDHVQCVQADPNLFGRYFDKGMFCAGERNGSSVCQGDSGGGLYVNEGDRWVLKGVVSFSGLNRNLSCDTSNFAGFANVQHYLDWIRNFTSTKDGVRNKVVSRRRSENACNQYKMLARKRSNGVCWNSRHQQSVGVIFDKGRIGCSGMLVSHKYVIVPCHCVWETEPKSIRMSFSESVDVVSTLCHPDFKSGIFENDIALLKLASEVELSSTLIPACLANNWTENVYDTLLLTGFFVNSESKQIDFMESVDNKWITEEECQRKSSAFGGLANISHLCVISPSKELEDNRGLSGSALQTFNTRTCIHTVLGLLNSVISDDSVFIYSRVSRVLDWIEEIVWGNVKETPTTTTPITEINDGKENFQEVIDNLDFVFPDQLKKMYKYMSQG